MCYTYDVERINQLSQPRYQAMEERQESETNAVCLNKMNHHEKITTKGFCTLGIEKASTRNSLRKSMSLPFTGHANL